MRPVLLCRGAAEFFKYSGGRYYKNWDTFSDQYIGYLNGTVTSYDPAYYYRQVWPLASFQAQCDRRQ
jgi:hypothetical protein